MFYHYHDCTLILGSICSFKCVYSHQEIDHIGYVRQAMEASSLGYFLEILESDTLKYSDVSNFLEYLIATILSRCMHAISY